MPAAHSSAPPLTTARQPFAEVGRVAMPRFVRLVAGERLTSPRAALTTSIVIRKSAAAR
jgi:LacI family transcriptional regulator